MSIERFHVQENASLFHGDFLFQPIVVSHDDRFGQLCDDNIINTRLCDRGMFMTPTYEEARKYCRFPPYFVSRFKAVRSFDVIVVSPELFDILQNDKDVQDITLNRDGMVNCPLSKVIEFHAKSMFEGKTPTPFEDAGLECALRLKYPLINGYKRNSFSSTIGRIVEEFCVWNTVDIVLHIRN